MAEFTREHTREITKNKFAEELRQAIIDDIDREFINNVRWWKDEYTKLIDREYDREYIEHD
jgi:hypothetical protein